MYRKGLTTEQIGDVYEDVYGKNYSKSQVSFLMNVIPTKLGASFVEIRYNMQEKNLPIQLITLW